MLSINSFRATFAFISPRTDHTELVTPSLYSSYEPRYLSRQLLSGPTIATAIVCSILFVAGDLERILIITSFNQSTVTTLVFVWPIRLLEFPFISIATI